MLQKRESSSGSLTGAPHAEILTTSRHPGLLRGVDDPTLGCQMRLSRSAAREPPAMSIPMIGMTRKDGLFAKDKFCLIHEASGSTPPRARFRS